MSLNITKVVLLSQNRFFPPMTKQNAIEYQNFQSFVKIKIFGYVTSIQEKNSGHIQQVTQRSIIHLNRNKLSEWWNI